MCDNTNFERCIKCGRYSVNECHGHKDKPTEEVIICSIGGTKKWERINGEYQYKSDNFCEWRLIDDEANVYDTDCRNPHILIDGTPKDNNYTFCPYCGRKIKII